MNIPKHENLVLFFATLVERQLRECLTSSSAMREIQREWKKSYRAVLPLATLGHEEDPQHLWSIVAQLDRRFRDYPDPDEDEALSMLRLESALDACSAQIIEQAQARVVAIYPRARLIRGLLEGYWCIAALLPRGSWKPPEKPLQLTLF